MAVITTGTHPKASWPGIHAWWGRTYNEHRPEYPDLFDEADSDKAYEEEPEITGFGLAPVKPQGQQIFYDTEVQGPVSRFTHVAYALGYIVTFEELRDDLYEVVSKRRAGQLAFSMRVTKENVLASIYNQAFNNSFPAATVFRSSTPRTRPCPATSRTSPRRLTCPSSRSRTCASRSCRCATTAA